ncbi:hypothetical protein KAR91_42770 [Candidatus Pacearchaeota archaeon]|nr:hypothetical protein [Candidatus Pacearchaeota archaeon]
MKAPQIIFIVLMAVQFTVHSLKHGESREPYHIGHTIINTVATVALLWWGGFWG